MIPKNRIKKSFAKNLALPAQLRGDGSDRSRPSDKRGPGHPDPEIKGGQSPKKFFGPSGLSLV